MEEVLLKGGSDGGLSRGGEASQPDGQTALARELVALTARKRRVPCDVAARKSVRRTLDSSGVCD